jgi:hypothetical protein
MRFGTNAWRLDQMAPVLGITCVDRSGIPSSHPLSSADMLDAMTFRFDVLHELPPDVQISRLKRWLKCMCRGGWMPNLVDIGIERSVRRVPGPGVPVHARGWVIRLQTDASSVDDARHALWVQILVVTLCRQLYAEAFIDCRLEYQQRVVAGAVLWR